MVTADIGEVLFEVIIFGSILTILASGFSLIYGVGKVLNLAHGAFYVLTAYLIFWILESSMIPNIFRAIWNSEIIAL